MLKRTVAVLALAALGVNGGLAAQAEANIDEGEIGRFQIYAAPRAGVVEKEGVDRHYIFLLDSYTGEVFTRVGSGNSWTPYAGGLDMAAHPKGEGWGKPLFHLAIASSGDSTGPTLLLTNTSTGASYTRSPKGDWVRFMGGAP